MRVTRLFCDSNKRLAWHDKVRGQNGDLAVKTHNSVSQRKPCKIMQITLSEILDINIIHIFSNATFSIVTYMNAKNNKLVLFFPLTNSLLWKSNKDFVILLHTSVLKHSTILSILQCPERVHVNAFDQLQILTKTLKEASYCAF